MNNAVRRSDVVNIGMVCSEKDVVSPASNFDVLVLNCRHQHAAKALEAMTEGSFVLINSDRQSDYSFIQYYKGTLITYGLNQKSCITASSIVDNERGGQLQICIQRGFPTICGGYTAVQEFPVHMRGLGAEMTLALVGLMLVCGTSMEAITNTFVGDGVLDVPF